MFLPYYQPGCANSTSSFHSPTMIHKFGTPHSRYADLISPSSSIPQIGLHRFATSSPRVIRIESMVLEKPVAMITRSYSFSRPPLRMTLSSVNLEERLAIAQSPGPRKASLFNVTLLNLDFPVDDLLAGTGFKVETTVLGITKSLHTSSPLTSPCLETFGLQAIKHFLVKLL